VIPNVIRAGWNVNRCILETTTTRMISIGGCSRDTGPSILLQLSDRGGNSIRIIAQGWPQIACLDEFGDQLMGCCLEGRSNDVGHGPSAGQGN
jgi:hypothetical protein